jgi:formate dehydrogenase subunit gamma
VSSDPNSVLRFRACERHLHWALAIPFKVCYFTALILVLVYNPDPSRPLRQVFSWIHRGSGICLAVLPLATILWHRRDFAQHLDNVRRAWTWSREDFKWLGLMGIATIFPRISLPHQGKFNAAEKLNFMSLTVTYPVYVMTGFTIWFFGPAFVSWLVHFSMATMATPLIIGHVFMATVNPDTRVGLSGMITGFVDRHWAHHHYRLWYDEHFGPQTAAEQPKLEAPVDVTDTVEPLGDAVADGTPRHSLPAPSANPSFAA